MGSMTRNASKAPRKRLPSIKRKENEKQAEKRAEKLVKTKRTKEPTPPPSIEPMEVDSIPEFDPTTLIDVSNLPYTLSTRCMLGSDEFNTDTDFMKLREFNWRQWNVQCIRKLEKAAEDGGFDTEWSSGHATIKARGVTKADSLSFEVEDDAGWKKVETFIETWMKQKKREIVVYLTAVWKKKGGNDSMDVDGHRLGKRMVIVISYSANHRPKRTSSGRRFVSRRSLKQLMLMH